MNSGQTFNLKDFLQNPLPKNKLPIYWILSTDYGDTQLTIDKLTCLQKPQENSVRYFDAEILSIETLEEELNAQFLFAERKILIIRRFEHSSIAVKKVLHTYLTAPSPATMLIISSQASNTCSHLLKIVEKKGSVLSLLEEKPWDKQQRLVHYVLCLATQAGKKITIELAQFFIKRIGTDTETVLKETEKLLTYVGSEVSIQQEHISTICIERSQEGVWVLRDAILARQYGLALCSLYALQLDGANALGTLQTIRLHLQTAERICELKKKHVSTAELSQAFPQLKGKNLEKTVHNAMAYGSSGLRRALLDVFNTDLALRSTIGSSFLLLELLVLKLMR